MGEGSRAAAKKFVARKKSFACGQIGDIKHREALGHDEFLDVHAAIRQRVKHLERRHRMIEKIFAGLECPPLPRPAQRFKRDPASHHAIFGEQPRNGALRCAARDVHVHAAGRESLVRPEQSHVQVSRRDNQQNQKEKKEGGACQSRAPVCERARSR